MISNFVQEKDNQNPSEQPQNKKFWSKIKDFFKSKKGRIILVVTVCVIVFGLTGLQVYNTFFKPDKADSGSQNGNLPDIDKRQAELVVSPLDGTLVEKSRANRHPLAVVIENHPDARPQYGLGSASLVYEAISEGGITRFLAIYGPGSADKVGPVRSARTFFIDWLAEFDAFFAHIGGNLDALDKIKTDKIKDLDQFAVGSLAYWRVPQVGKATEHTMFSSTLKLYNVAASKGWDVNSARFTAYQFKEDAKAGERPVAQTVAVDYSAQEYNVRWLYVPKDNVYSRELAGAAHKDGATGAQLQAKNVVVIEMQRWYAPTRINESGWAMKTIGEGKAKVFQDGKAIEGTWKKTGRTERTLLYTTSGEQVKFNPGVTWFEIVSPGTAIKVQ